MILLYIIFGLFVCNGFSWEVGVRFVDIGGIVDNHCSDFLFITFCHVKISFWNDVLHLYFDIINNN